MNEKIKLAYSWMAWGVFCSVIHLKVGSLQVLPPFVGFGMVAWGLYSLSQAGEWKADRILFPALALLVAFSFAGTVSSLLGLTNALQYGILAMVLPALEFVAFYSGMNLMAKSGRKVRGWQAGYLIAETVGLVSGVFGTLWLVPTFLMFMALAFIAGKMLFFCCAWGESRRAVRE